MLIKDDMLQRVLNIGIALSKEHHREQLLDLILTMMINLSHCDGGNIYLKKEAALECQVMVLRSRNLRLKSQNGNPVLPSILPDSGNICACSVQCRKLINIPDIAACKSYSFSADDFSRLLPDYSPQSMMVIPMEDDHNEVIGLVQLVNAQDEKGQPIPFAEEYEQILYALCSQAAICLVNIKYARQIEHMFDSFIKVMSTAIDARTPYNANHTFNMVRYAKNFVQWLNAQDLVWKFDENTEKTFLMSIWLHDIGKLVTPLEVMNKQDRLGLNHDFLIERLHKISLLTKLAFYEQKIGQEEKEKRLEKIKEALQLINRVNSQGPLEKSDEEELLSLKDLTYQEEDGRVQPWIRPLEMDQLLIRTGTLTSQERKTMQEHVVMTERMLEQMDFTGSYKNVLIWASRHHELLDGSGYPRGLKGSDLSREVRLLTILDIFEALTAEDRPYKPPKPVDQTFLILHHMAERGEIDEKILKLFEESRAWDCGRE